MIEQGHLQVFDLTLTTQAPLFVGCGKKVGKKEYLFEKSYVHMIDQVAFFDFLIRRDFLREYESFMLSDKKNLRDFVYGECKLDKMWVEKSSPFLHSQRAYKLAVTEDVSENNNTKEIWLFNRDAQNRAYIPGSSLKGALRTAWLASEMLNEPEEAKKDHSLKKIASTENKKSVFPEEKYTNRTIHERPEELKNRAKLLDTIFRGVQVSDSEIISNDSMILAGRTHLPPLSAAKMGRNSLDSHPNVMQFYQECVRPGVTIRFRLTLDQSIMRQHRNPITVESLLKAIATFSEFYEAHFMVHFPQSTNNSSIANLPKQPHLIVGGGTGFFSKTLGYPYMEDNETAALEWTQQFMRRNFPANHRHDLDKELGISPHTMKYVQYGSKLYPAGFCGVSIE